MRITECSGPLSIGEEFVGARFGDARLSARCVRLAEGLARSAGESLPRALGADREAEAAYRFLGNVAVSPAAILQPHFDQTVARCATHDAVLILHDTTEFEFSSHREGLGHLRRNDHGFLLHASFAVTADGKKRPLGVAGSYTWTRQGRAHRKTSSASARRKRADKESSCWLQQIHATETRFDGVTKLIHVADSEGDAYPFLSSMVTEEIRFVVREARDRLARDADDIEIEKVSSLLVRADDVFEVEVPLSPRAPKPKKLTRASRPARDSRMAKLVASATRVELKRPAYLHDEPEWTPVNVVRVRELDAPDGVAPVEWVLFTTEPIDTYQQVAAILEFYRTRWLIEEFFKAIKTGCEFEKLQLESYDALSNALAFYLPIAWRMLQLRSFVRADPTEPAQSVLSNNEIEVLQLFGRLPPRPNVKDALLAIAMMGGYLKNKRPPGWMTLARGFEKLLLREEGWAARKNSSATCADS